MTARAAPLAPGDALTPQERGYAGGMAPLIAAKEAARAAGGALFAVRCQVLAGYGLAGDATFGPFRSATLRRMAAELAGYPPVRVARVEPAGEDGAMPRAAASSDASEA